MLTYDPSTRIQPTQALAHHFFSANVDLGCNTEYTGLRDVISTTNTGSSVDGVFEMDFNGRKMNVGVQKFEKKEIKGLK